MRRSAMYNNHNSLLHNLGVTSLCYFSYLNLLGAWHKNYNRYHFDILLVHVDRSV